jgi:hypothetical protein
MLSKLCQAAAADNPQVLTAVESDSTGLPRVLEPVATAFHPTDAVEVGMEKSYFGGA